MVRDAEASAEFYIKCFGFKLYSDQEIMLPPNFPVSFGKADSERAGRFITVKGRHPLTGMIGLISVEGPIENRITDGQMGVGDIVLVIETEDLDESARQIALNGGKVTFDIYDTENTGDEDGNKVPSRRLFAADPDGYILEVFQPA